jgi:flavin reductase (DIM6/NTAB) family NADH-FMN oxidoreductase RutF
MTTDNICDARAASPVDQARFRAVMGSFCTGLTVVTGFGRDGDPVGFTCQAFASLSLDPPLVMICPARSSTTWPLLRASGRLCVNVLRSDQQQLSHRFATWPTGRFEGVDWHLTPRGVPRLGNCLASVDCEVVNEYDGGDHTIVVAAVTGLHDNEGDPLLFFRGGYSAPGWTGVSAS